MAKTTKTPKITTSFKVCYLDGNGNPVTKNINDLTPEERGSIEKMLILSTGKSGMIGDFSSALSAKKNENGEIVRIGFPNLKVIYGPAGVTKLSVEALLKDKACPNLENYVSCQAKGGVYPKYISSNGIAIDNNFIPSGPGAYAVLLTDSEAVSDFVSADDFYNTIVKSSLGESEPTSIVTFKVNPSKAKASSNIPVPGELRQKANDIRARQELKEGTNAILGIVSALKDNGVDLTKEQEERLLNGFESFVVANKGLGKEDAEAMKLNLQEDIYNIGVKLRDISDDNAEVINNNIVASKNAILDRLQTMSKKAEQTSASDRAVSFAEHSKTRTVVANEGKRTTQETVEALKEYLSSEDFARFVAESTPVDKVLDGVGRIAGAQTDDIGYLLQEIGVKLSAPQEQRLVEAFNEGLEDSATSTAKTIQDMIDFATESVKAQMTADGVNLTSEQEKFFTENLSRKFLEERILGEKTIKDTVGKATSATISKIDDIYARLDEEMASGFAMVGEDIANATSDINANTNNATSGLSDDHVHLYAQGEQVLEQGERTAEELAKFKSDMDSSMMGLGSGVAGIRRQVSDEGEKTREELEKRLSASEEMNKALQEQLKAMSGMMTELMNVQTKMIEAQNQMKNEILMGSTNNTNALLAQMKVLTDNARGSARENVAPGVAPQSTTTPSSGANVSTNVGAVADGKPASVRANNQTEKEPQNLLKEYIDQIRAIEDKAKGVANTGVSEGKKNRTSGQLAEDKKVETKEHSEKKKDNKAKVLKKTSERTTMLAEPKLPWYKRMGKFIVRHPLRSVLVGLGAGALVATGLGAVALGGFAPALATANAFFPTIAVGGVAGAGLGAVGSVVSRFSRKGKRERAYTKFMNKYKKAQKKADKIVEKQAELERLSEKKQELREKHRSGSLFAKVGVYKVARHINRKVYRLTLKRSHRAVESYYENVEKAGTYKKILNNMEERANISTAHGGALQKRRKIDNLLEKNKISVEEAVEDRDDLDFDNPGILKVSDDYKTGDTEMMNLFEKLERLGSTPLSRKNIMMKNSINKRNSQTKYVVGEEDIIDKKDDPRYAIQQEELNAYKKAKEAKHIDENDNYIGM